VRVLLIAGPQKLLKAAQRAVGDCFEVGHGWLPISMRMSNSWSPTRSIAEQVDMPTEINSISRQT
jgi:hypothetical protein